MSDDDEPVELRTIWYCLFTSVGCDWTHEVTTVLTDEEREIIASYPEPARGIEIVTMLRNRRLELVLGAHMREHGFTTEDAELLKALSEPGT